MLVFLNIGSQVLEGSAKFLVLEVGQYTQSGQIMAMLSTIEANGTNDDGNKVKKLYSEINSS
jgi:hypothetical protein